MSKNYKRLKKTQLLQKCQQLRLNPNNKAKRKDLIQLLIDYDLQINNERLELEISQSSNKLVDKNNKECIYNNNINQKNSNYDLEISIIDNNTFHQESNYIDSDNYVNINNYIDSNNCDNYERNIVSNHTNDIDKHLLQLIKLKRILEYNTEATYQNNTEANNIKSNNTNQLNNNNNSNNSKFIHYEKDSITLQNSNNSANNLLYLLRDELKNKILEKEKDWSQKKKIQDWEQYQINKINLITQRPCLFTQERFHIPTGNLVNIETDIIKIQDNFFEYTEHFLVKQDIMGKTFYYTSKFESDSGGQAIRCMREAYQLLKYQLQFLLTRWQKYQKQLLDQPDIKPPKEIFFINIINGDIAEHYIKNLIYLKNKSEYQDINKFIMIGDLTYFALYWIQYHRDNFVLWEKYQLKQKLKNLQSN